MNRYNMWRKSHSSVPPFTYPPVKNGVLRGRLRTAIIVNMPAITMWIIGLSSILIPAGVR